MRAQKYWIEEKACLEACFDLVRGEPGIVLSRECLPEFLPNNPFNTGG
jgi:hypothetical protein